MTVTHIANETTTPLTEADEKALNERLEGATAGLDEILSDVLDGEDS